MSPLQKKEAVINRPFCKERKNVQNERIYYITKTIFAKQKNNFKSFL